MRKGPGLFVAIGVLFIASGPATAQSTITFQFDTVVDTTQVGGGPNTSARVTFSFLADLSPGSGPFGTLPFASSYGPISLTLQIGAESVSVSGADTGIGVFNDAGTTTLEDSYSAFSSPGATYSGRLFGLSVQSIDVHLVDSNLDMFSSTDLPRDPGFAGRADQSYLQVQLVDDLGGSVLLSNFGQNAAFSLVIPPSVCSSTVTSLSELHAEVAGLHTSAGAKQSLSAIIDEVQAALDAGVLGDARNGLGKLIKSVINRSTRDEPRPGRIEVVEANHLACSAANVVIGIAGQ